MVCVRPSSSSTKSFCFRLLTILPFLSCTTTANRLTTFTSVEYVVGACVAARPAVCGRLWSRGRRLLYGGLLPAQQPGAWQQEQGGKQAPPR